MYHLKNQIYQYYLREFYRLLVQINAKLNLKAWFFHFRPLQQSLKLRYDQLLNLYCVEPLCFLFSKIRL